MPDRIDYTPTKSGIVVGTDAALISTVRSYPPVAEWDEPGLVDDLLRTLADRLEAANREMHARELHHFEEEQESATLTARLERVKAGISEALESLNENEDPDTVVIDMLTAILTEKEA